MAHVIKDRVLETSTTTGTGAFTLAGAVTGYLAFSDRHSVGDTCFYTIEAVDGVGAPSGEWEVGFGTYSAANTLTRTTVLASSNSDAAVNFSAGTKRVFLSFSATQAAWIRERVTADRTYYVRTDGSDSNDGSANTAAAAFLTIQKAIDVVADTLDIAAGRTVVIQVADGTYAPITLRKTHGAGKLVIRGNTATPANCIISGSSATAVSCPQEAGVFGVLIEGFKITTTTSGHGLYVVGTSSVLIANCTFGPIAGTAVLVVNGGNVQFAGDVTFAGSIASHVLHAQHSGVIVASSVLLTFSSMSVSGSFAYARYGGVIHLGFSSWSGSFTGKRYDAAGLSLVSTFGQATTWIPGSVAGTTATGSVYT